MVRLGRILTILHKTLCLILARCRPSAHVTCPLSAVSSTGRCNVILNQVGRWLEASFSMMLAKSGGAIKKHFSRYNLFPVFLFGIQHHEHVNITTADS